jgi:D-aminoacyl-tRNA deacylase
MRIIIQRVNKASITIDNKEEKSIAKGIVVLLGIEEKDDVSDVDWLLNKMLNLRIFDDNNGVMNLSLLDIAGGLLIVSQFTLHASTKKGKRPSYINAAKPEKAIPLYEGFVAKAKEQIANTKTGEFGAYMKINLENDGPVTIFIDSKNKE